MEEQQQQAQQWQAQQRQAQIGFPPGFQTPFQPMAPPSQMVMPQPMPASMFFQAPDYSQLHDSGGMYGAYTPLYPQLQPQGQNMQTCGYAPYLPYPLQPHLVWPQQQQQQQPPAWHAPQAHSESSSGKMQGGGDDRGWKRSRDGNINGNKRPPGGWPQKTGNFRPQAANRLVLRCEPCDRNFSGRNQMDAHMKTHMKCGVDNCSFEGIGRAVNEHRQLAHAKANTGSSRPLTKEGEDEVRRWREARRKHYPSTANLQRKLQDMQARKQRGELVDEDALMRQESLKQILAKQAALGCAVAEVPAYYLSQRYAEKGLSTGERVSKAARFSTEDNGNRKQGKKVCVYFQKGHCKKGRRCGFLHDNQKTNRNCDKESAGGEKEEERGKVAEQERAPSLLAKLLSSEMKRDKSHLLQCFRFFISNKFLAEDSAALKFTEWEQSGDCEAPAISLAATDEDGDEEEEEEEEEDDEEDDDAEQEDEGEEDISVN